MSLQSRFGAALAGLIVSLAPALARADGLPAKFRASGDCVSRFAGSDPAATGIDVSKFQGDIDWQRLERQGLHFVIMRAAYGRDPDPDFERNWKDADATCMLRAPYQFFLAHHGPSAQAEAMHGLVKEAMAGGPELPPVVDVEAGSYNGDLCRDRVAAQRFAADLAAYLNAFERASGRQMMIYTAENFWKCLPAHPDLPGGRPLWIASYTEARAPDMPPGWQSWTFWQRTDRAKAEGIDGKVDGDRFNGSPSAVLEFAAKAGQAP